MEDTHKRLTDALEKEAIDLADWSEETSDINDILSDDVGLGALSVDYLGNNNGIWTVVATYYSDTLSRSVVIDWDAYTACETYAELAEHLLDLLAEAKQIEALIAK